MNRSLFLLLLLNTLVSVFLKPVVHLRIVSPHAPVIADLNWLSDQ